MHYCLESATSGQCKISYVAQKEWILHHVNPRLLSSFPLICSPWGFYLEISSVWKLAQFKSSVTQREGSRGLNLPFKVPIKQTDHLMRVPSRQLPLYSCLILQKYTAYFTLFQLEWVINSAEGQVYFYGAYSIKQD